MPHVLIKAIHLTKLWKYVDPRRHAEFGTFTPAAQAEFIGSVPIFRLDRFDPIHYLAPMTAWSRWRQIRIAIVCILGIGDSTIRLDASNRSVFPDTEWTAAKPETQNIDPTKLKHAIDFLKNHSGRDGVSELLIIRNGYAIWSGTETTNVHGIWSGTKAFTSTCLGLLIDQKRCNLETRAAEILPEMAPAFQDVTLRHFTTMTSGYRAQNDEQRGNYTHGPSGTPFKPDSTALFTPGTRYAYWDSAMNQFGHVLTKIAHRPLEDLFDKRIASKIGMKTERWNWGSFEQTVEPKVNGGAGNNGNGIQISATELARLGWLFLNKGRWKTQQLLSSNWVQQATSVQVPASLPLGHPESGIDGPGSYGFNWWCNGIQADGTQKWQGAPTSTFAASGYNNNDLFVIPDWNIVVVRLGLDEQEHKITDNEYSTFLTKLGLAINDTTISGDRVAWHPITLTFRGPQANENDSKPNPFLDFRLQVRFRGKNGREYDVPGYFAGNGTGSSGNQWKVHFTPDQAGLWRYEVAFRKGNNIATSLQADAGDPVSFHGDTGSFSIAPRNPEADGFQKWGRLEYADSHYLKFRDGPYWIRGGTDSPENFLAFEGFDNTPPSHRYPTHIEDWNPGDPDWEQGKGRGIIGAINSLATQGVNSLYFLTMNIGGDGGDVWPWIGRPNPKGNPSNDNSHFDLSKLDQWNTVFDHAQRKGLFLHFVLNEAERQNKIELDEGDLGLERKLYYRELIARFGHHLALQWNLCEEYNLQLDFGAQRIRAFAECIRAVDPYDHPITVHSAGDPEEQLRFTIGDPLFSLTSVQLNHRRIDTLVENLRKATIDADRPLPISVDEFSVDVGQDQSWKPFDRPILHRRTKLWPTLFSGGMIEFILEDLLDVESFKTPERAALWKSTRIARTFMEENLPFWLMEPADDKVIGESTLTVGRGKGDTFELGAQVFDLPGITTAIYYPTTRQPGRIDLSDYSGRLKMRWFNPRTGEFEGRAKSLTGGFPYSPDRAPSDEHEDWVVLIQKP